MPMIDLYATRGTFKDPKSLARELATTLMKIEKVPDIPMFRQNTAGFVHDLPNGALSNVEGDGNYVRVQVLTNAGALDRDKQLAVVRQFTDLLRVPELRPLAKLAPGLDSNEVWVSGDGGTLYVTSADGRRLITIGADGTGVHSIDLPAIADGFVASEHG